MKTHQGLHIDREMIDKYTLRGPRYTSYPTAPEWSESVGEEAYRRHIHETNRPGNTRPLSIYLHIPFCGERCYYCACNVIITNHEEVKEDYVDLITREVEMVAGDLSPQRRVVQFHLGGGTPTHLTPAQLARLFSSIFPHFTFDSDAERSIEVDLRVTTEDHLRVLREFGFNRISSGVQDFSEETQIAINRMQSHQETVNFVHTCREYGFDSVNVDLVYGLPHQTLETFNRTIDALLEADPDRIALYNYAHLPAKLAYQRRILEEWLPTAEERFSIFQLAVERLTETRYEYIGMDHFAKPNDELTRALHNGTLQRNFMGFTTRAGTDLYSFGTSSISLLQTIYVQNVKNLRLYRNAIKDNRLPLERGLELTRDDQVRRWVIMELMCNLRISARRFQETWGDEFSEYFADELPRLQPFIDDGLLEPNVTEQIQVTELGQIIVRPIAMVFDAYLTRVRKAGATSPVFSRTL